MCGRYTLATPDLGQLRARWPLSESLEIQRRYNVAPGDDVLAVVGRGDGRAAGNAAALGPRAVLGVGPKEVAAKTINARAETVAERPAYRDAFERRRCLIVADGFFEWSGGVPHWITREDGAPFAFAGLWARGGRRARRERSSRCAPARSSRPRPPGRCARCTTACRSSSRPAMSRPGSTPRRRPRRCTRCSPPPARRSSRTGRSAATSTTPARRAGLPRPARAGVAVLSAGAAGSATERMRIEVMTTGSMGTRVGRVGLQPRDAAYDVLGGGHVPEDGVVEGGGTLRAVTMKNWLPDVPGRSSWAFAIATV